MKRRLPSCSNQLRSLGILILASLALVRCKDLNAFLLLGRLGSVDVESALFGHVEVISLVVITTSERLLQFLRHVLEYFNEVVELFAVG